jgi:anti-sigma factor RsiW
MKCTEARKLLYLNRSGELTEHESRELERHCTGCASCAAERDKARASGTMLEGLRAFVPAPKNPEALTSSILARIRNEPVRGQAQRSSFLDWILGWFYAPALRYSSALVIAVAVVAFVGEQLSIVHSVSNLESRHSDGVCSQS